MNILLFQGEPQTDLILFKKRNGFDLERFLIRLENREANTKLSKSSRNGINSIYHVLILLLS